MWSCGDVEMNALTTFNLELGTRNTELGTRIPTPSNLLKNPNLTHIHFFPNSTFPIPAM